MFELLRHDRESNSPLHQAHATREIVPAADDLIGRHIGHYRIDRLIGSGGMGHVYEAVQDPPSRRVAFKVLRRAVASQQMLRRFEIEAQVLGRLNHPSVAQVYEAGTLVLDHVEVPFFAMELVPDARSITEYADQLGLGTRPRIELLLQACDAVQHGHQKGVVHRDLKPANLLVDTQGRVKVIDFGVARTTDADTARASMQTHAGQLVGTLAYMSPEQCEADPAAIDTRSDVYSLGVVLYELLCGAPPYELGSLSIPAATRVIREHAPIRPSLHRGALRGDAEAILLKALEKDRARRYPTAESMASDLRRMLNGRPIEARAPTLWSSMIAWILGHRAASTAIACGVLSVTTLLSTWAGVHILTGRPSSVVLDGPRGKALLQTRAGVVLKEWPEGTLPGSVVGVRLVSRAPEHGGGRLALIASWRSPHAEESIGVVEAYDVDAPDDLVWTTASTPLVLPPGEPIRKEARFGLSIMLVADMLEGTPGEEVLVVQRLHPFSATAVRVFDLLGRLRYEAWHDGAIDSAVWLDGARRVVLTGVDGQHLWRERGLEVPEGSAAYPLVVLGLELMDGRNSDPWWMVRSGKALDPSIAWIRWLGPAHGLVALQPVRLGATTDVGSLRRGWHVGIEVKALLRDPPEPKPAFSMLLDGEGREVSRYVYDGLRARTLAGVCPPDSDYRLLPYADLPSFVGARAAIAPPSAGPDSTDR
ncbi:MAG: serine/threonine protein kinase [Planctomycetes bacterium]|nr:serine/threonine protein kinase [Planctomycetota bacterium]